MKHFVVLLCLAFGSLFFSSCMTFYYSTVNSINNQVPQNEDGTFTVRKNDISITYSFSASGGGIVYEIHNDSDDPIFVDWSRSVLIAEDYAVQYRSNRARIDGSARTSTTTYRFTHSDFVTSTSHSSLTGQVLLPQNELFIPPRARVSHSPLALSSVLDLDIPSSAYERQAMVNVATFSKENTPLRFRSYLTVVNDRDRSQTVFENTFYVSEIIRTGSRNNLLQNQANKYGNQFYIPVVNRRATNIGWTAFGAGVTALFVIMFSNLTEMPTPPR